MISFHLSGRGLLDFFCKFVHGIEAVVGAHESGSSTGLASWLAKRRFANRFQLSEIELHTMHWIEQKSPASYWCLLGPEAFEFETEVVLSSPVHEWTCRIHGLSAAVMTKCLNLDSFMHFMKRRRRN